MTVTSIDKDLENLTLTVTAEFAAPVERVWELWADPRLLERWWGPPGYPATFETHDLTPGAEIAYYLTSPEGEKYRAWWRITAVNPPTSLELMDGFADQDGKPNADLPVSSMRVQLTEHQGGTRMEARSQYDSLESLEKVLAMGVEEGIRAAMGQIDGLLAVTT